MAPENVLTGVHLKVAIFNNPPDLIIQTEPTSGSVEFHGPFIQLIHWLSSLFMFTYTIVPLKLGANGTEYDYVKEFVRRSDLDILLPQTVVTQMRNQIVDFTACIDSRISALLLPATQLESFMWAPIRPFKLMVWILLIVSGLATAVTMSLSAKRRSRTSRFSVQLESLYVLSVLTGQGELRLPGLNEWSWGFRICAGVWSLAAVVFLNSYCSVLISYLTTSEFRQYPQTSFGIVEDGSLSYLITRGGLGQEMIMSATKGPLKKMGDVFRKHPEYLVRNREEGYDLVASGCCAFMDFMPFIRSAVYEDYKKTGKCRFSLGGTVNGYGFSALILKKNSPFTPLVTSGILRMQQAGLYQFWTRGHGGGHIPCLSKEKPVHQRRILSLENLTFPLAFLAVGWGVAFISFLIEQRSRRYVKIRNAIGQTSVIL